MSTMFSSACRTPTRRRRTTTRGVARPGAGGSVSTRPFIRVRVHTAIGVLGAVSAATALLLPGAAGAELTRLPAPGQPFDVEHPSGHLLVDVDVDTSGAWPLVRRAGVVRTARKLFDGTVYAASLASPEHR